MVCMFSLALDLLAWAEEILCSVRICQPVWNKYPNVCLENVFLCSCSSLKCAWNYELHFKKRPKKCLFISWKRAWSQDLHFKDTWEGCSSSSCCLLKTSQKIQFAFPVNPRKDVLRIEYSVKVVCFVVITRCPCVILSEPWFVNCAHHME